MKKPIKKTDHGLSRVIIETFNYIDELFEDPLTTVQKDRILEGGLVALTQILLKEPFGECSLSVLYDECDFNTGIREVIQDIPDMYELLKETEH